MRDPLLNQYSVIMLDEVHERTMLIDIIMGLMKKILKVFNVYLFNFIIQEML